MTVNYVIGLNGTIQELTALFMTVHDNIRKYRTIQARAGVMTTEM